MSNPGTPDAVAAAQAYEEALVPALMAEWPSRVIAAAEVRAGQRVLDVACGTGVLTRAVADAVGPGGSVVGLDIDAGMLAVARARRPDVEWREGSAMSLPFADASFDAVVSQFGFMFFPDGPAALREIWRVLAPGGRMAIAVWASLDETPAYDIETRLIERLGGPATSAPMRVPFRMGERASFAAQFTDAGVPLAALETVQGVGRFPSIRAMVSADIVGWLPIMGVHLASDVIAEILDAAERELAAFRLADGSVEFASPAHIAVADKRA